MYTEAPYSSKVKSTLWSVFSSPVIYVMFPRNTHVLPQTNRSQNKHLYIHHLGFKRRRDQKALAYSTERRYFFVASSFRLRTIVHPSTPARLTGKLPPNKQVCVLLPFSAPTTTAGQREREKKKTRGPGITCFDLNVCFFKKRNPESAYRKNERSE